jgi:hypothetical protein
MTKLTVGAAFEKNGKYFLLCAEGITKSFEKELEIECSKHVFCSAYYGQIIDTDDIKDGVYNFTAIDLMFKLCEENKLSDELKAFWNLPSNKVMSVLSGETDADTLWQWVKRDETE